MKTTLTTIRTQADLGLLLPLLVHKHGYLEPEEIQQLLEEEFGVYFSIQDIVFHANAGVEEEDARINLRNCGVNY